MLFDGILSCLGIINGSPFSPNGTNQNAHCHYTPKFVARFTTRSGDHEHFVCGHHARHYRKYGIVLPLEQFVGPIPDDYNSLRSNA